jgi:hypothetical protein
MAQRFFQLPSVFAESAVASGSPVRRYAGGFKVRAVQGVS